MRTAKQIEAGNRNHAILRLKGMAAMTRLNYKLAAGGHRVIFTVAESKALITLINNALRRLGAETLDA